LRLLKLARTTSPAAAFSGTDSELVAAFLRHDEGARAALYRRYGEHVHRVLRRILGAPEELADLHHDVFVRAIVSLHKLEDPCALKAWLTMIAVHVARTAIARRRRSRWLWFMPPSELPEVQASVATSEQLDAVRATYAVLDMLAPDDRIAFALRFIDGMELTEIAQACRVSLATLKRRLVRAEARFVARARKEPALVAWIEGGSRWADR
jgi:RNA polymerase sigma-70 factor (ECF subfamily)